MKQILVIAGGLVLAVSLPLAALAVTTDRTPPLDDDVVAASDQAPQSMAQQQPMVQQRLRVHADTGPPEGFEPVRQRLHRTDPVMSGQQDMLQGGNPDAPNGGSRGDCSNRGGSAGAGSARFGGGGAQGRGGRGMG